MISTFNEKFSQDECYLRVLYHLTRRRLQRPPVSLAWRLDREMRMQLVLHETGFTR